MTIKAGDKVRRTGPTSNGVVMGEEYTVVWVAESGACVQLVGLGTFKYNMARFEKLAAKPAELPQGPTKTPDNPKKLYGDKKPPVHLIHPIADLHESAALHSGALKYGMNNYMETPVEALTYVGAIKRHLSQWLSGERVDAKELVHHLGAIKACCTILLTAEACGSLIDNRPGAFAVQPLKASDRDTYTKATAEAFREVEGVIEHLNKLYPVKPTL